MNWSIFFRLWRKTTIVISKYFWIGVLPIVLLAIFDNINIYIICAILNIPLVLMLVYRESRVEFYRIYLTRYLIGFGLSAIMTDIVGIIIGSISIFVIIVLELLSTYAIYCQTLFYEPNYNVIVENDYTHLVEGNDENCSICLEPMIDNRVKVINCSHNFHKDCLDEWLVRQRSCPLCRIETAT